MIRRHGIIEAVEREVNREAETQVYPALVEMGLEKFAFEAVILRHEAMMDAIWDVAARRGLDVVDGLHAIDADRGGYLASFVHLTPQGNGALAAVIAGVVGTDLVPQEGVRLNR